MSSDSEVVRMAESIPLGVREHFDEIALAYYNIVDRLWYDVGYYHRRESEILSSFLNRRPKLAIDAGCGPGRHTAALQRRSLRTVAVDVSRKMLEETRRGVLKNSNAGVDFIQADIRKLPFKPGVSDFILSFEVLEHLPGNRQDPSI